MAPDVLLRAELPFPESLMGENRISMLRSIQKWRLDCDQLMLRPGETTMTNVLSILILAAGYGLCAFVMGLALAETFS